MRLEDDPIVLAPRASDAEVNARARQVVAIINSAKNGPKDEAATWIKAARELNATVVKGTTKGDDPGLYWRRKSGEGIIVYDPRADEAEICRRIVHELAHHVQSTYKISALRNGIERYNDDRETLQHRIARRVEEILLG
jgi:hypothetical protein